MLPSRCPCGGVGGAIGQNLARLDAALACQDFHQLHLAVAGNARDAQNLAGMQGHLVDLDTL